ACSIVSWLRTEMGALYLTRTLAAPQGRFCRFLRNSLGQSTELRSRTRTSIMLLHWTNWLQRFLESRSWLAHANRAFCTAIYLWIEENRGRIFLVLRPLARRQQKC